MKLPIKIKELRIKFGFTQSSLAAQLGITRSAVNAWEMGVALPSTETVVKLARIFGVPSDYLLGIDDVKTISAEGLSTREIKSVEGIIACFRERPGGR
jgi:transcriptional regulator with XRE-family HTH domain